MSEEKPTRDAPGAQREHGTDELWTTADFRTDLREFEHEQYSNDRGRRRDLKLRRDQAKDKER